MAKKAKVKVKPKPNSGKSTNRELIGKTKVRTIAHIQFDANGQKRKKGW
ncbi:MAG: hypothetical protein HDR82_09595 [Bacteroides sp.]|nr:hypothetical protein [Bacteroides sp.]